MSNVRFETHSGEPPAEEKEVMIKGMLAHHAVNGHERKVSTYSIVLKNNEDVVLGMIIATFLYNGMEISTLWVDETVRKQGLGKKLMNLIEAEGIKRGSAIAYTNTFPWQAPGFYEKLGYTLYGKLEGVPAGSHLSYYCKKLQ
jgi:ribosomal protein S18 acetylase RimI-like enzyme